MNGKTLLFWLGVIFMFVAPIVLGITVKDATTTWVAALCGAFITIIAKIEDIAELSFGPLRARMRETLNEADEIIKQLKEIASTSARATLSSLMSDNFMGGMTMRARFELHDQMINMLKNINVPEDDIEKANELWNKGVSIIYHRIIRNALEGRTSVHRINQNASEEVLDASSEFQSLLNFEEWHAPSPMQMTQFLNERHMMNKELSEWISDYQHFLDTGEILRRELFMEIK